MVKQIIILFIIVLVTVVGILYAQRRFAILNSYASRDGLTGLLNRVFGEKEINHRISSQSGGQGIFALIDVDNFKSVNDFFGHERGDQILKDMAQTFQKFFYKNATVCRIGGDEFVIYIEVHHTIEDTREKLELLANSVRKDISDGNNTVRISCSIGAVEVPRDGDKFAYLCYLADKALYRSKALGRDCITYYSEELERNVRDQEQYAISLTDYRGILDSIQNMGVYVIRELDHRVLYYNQMGKVLVPDIEVGAICEEAFENIGSVIQSRIMWQGRVPAFVIQVAKNLT